MFLIAVWYLLSKPTIRHWVSNASNFSRRTSSFARSVLGVGAAVRPDVHPEPPLPGPGPPHCAVAQQAGLLRAVEQPPAPGKTIRAVPLSPRAPAQATSPHHGLACLEKTNHMCSSGSIHQQICLCLIVLFTCFIQSREIQS